MSRRLVSRAGRLFIAVALLAALVAVASHFGLWQKITGNSAAAWDWVERSSWFSAVASLILTIVYERRARQGGGPGGEDRRIFAIGLWNRIEVPGDRPVKPEPVIPARPAEPDRPVNHLPERATLEAELAGPRSAVVLVYGPAGAGKTTLVESVLRATDLGATRERFDLVADESFGAAELVRILGKNTARPPQELRDDPLQSLHLALESRTDPGVAVVIDGAQRILEPTTNKISDFDLNEALAVIAARRDRRVKVILITREQPIAAASSRWTTDDAVHIPVNRLAPEDFKQYLAILDPGDAEGMQAGSDDLCDLLQGMPRNANLFWAALTLPVDRPSVRELTRRLERPRRKDRPSTLARMVVDSLTPEQHNLVAAVAAYDMPVLSEDVVRLVGDGISPVRVEELLDELAEHHVIVRLAAPPRYCLTDPEILGALQRDGQNMEALRRKAANLLSNRRKPKVHVRGPGDLTVEFTELRITLRNRDWLAAFDRIQALDQHLVKWNASGLIMDARTQVIGRLEDAFDELRNFNALGYARASRGLMGPAVDAYERALALAGTQDRPDELRRKILANIADLEWQHGKIQEAERRYRKVLKLAVRDGDDEGRMVALSGIADCRRRHGDHRQAVTLGREALSLAREQNAYGWEIDISVKVARWLSEQEESAPAWELMTEAAVVAGERPNPAYRARCLDGQADLHLDDGDWVAARTSAAEALRHALDIHDPVTVLQARTTLAMAALRLGDLEAARTEIDRAGWYRREKRSLIVLALQALIAFREDPDGEARTLFETLEREAAQRRNDDPDDFAAWELEAIAICGLGVDRPGRAAAAKTAFGKARTIAPDFPVVKERLQFMLGIVAASSTVHRELVAAATGDAVRGFTP
ncbi:tetratricopeptide repeat protein [Micromonospora sp. WMMD812]|uniref:tetratricopeptide repeat protein n=1 Tax=Micromonospora sp. WMMD812 TaxID=3015152 RepID=UPI00248B3CBE|nr:tetratricopeptide repeat protein [Micromonospora sp. WMMD812]WBB69136.1 tetratricopeptide repeat protein [Micromonospora sp. WMMD812]